ncbi:MAG: integrin alpha, partial [Chitinophagales bacterium]
IEDDNVRIDFTNDAEGMRQDFIIKNQISGEGKLKVKFNTETNLSMNVNEDALNFKDQDGNEKMRYASLKVWDSQGKILKAYFEKSSHQVSDQNISNAKNNSIISKNVKQFCIVVEDENAVYPITIDPISTSPNWITEGNQIQGGYGYAVSSAGDVNNDGYSDVLIGAPFYDNGQTNEGKVFAYYGTAAGLMTIALWTAEGNQAEAQFGNSVAGAGDINNDGYSDVIIGASVFDNDLPDEGRVFLYNGSITGLVSNPSWAVESNQSGSQFGWSVSGAGDVNNDGYSDVIVGAPLYSNGQANEGRAFVYHGSAGGLSTDASWTGESNQIGAFYGYSVASAGDVNNDGYSDIIVGATTYDNPRRDEGRVYVYNGSAGGVSSNNVWSPTSISSFFANFGGSVSSAGDINGDGFSDVLIGAYSYDNVETDEGKAYVYHGSSAGLSLLPNWVAESNQAFANFGHSVSTAGDFNKDGFDDIVIGSRRYDNGETDEGAAFLYYGSASGLSSISNLIFESNQIEAYFGTSVASAGDVNGDGFSDVIAGAYLFDNGQSDEGGAFVYYGAPAIFKVLTLRTYIQGFYNNYSNLMAQDTFKVFLMETFSPFSTVDSAVAIINPSGIAVLNFSNAENGVDYFIKLKHRNSIETWSSRGKRFENGLMNYDFASDSRQAFGHNMPQVDESPVAFAIYVGDVNQDGFINLIDILAVSNNSSEFINGYVITDLNGDNLTNLHDIIAVYNNSNTFVAGIHP